MAYATVEDVQSRMAKELTGSQQDVCNTLLDDAAVLIDACKTNATDDQKKVVSCSMVMRAMGSANEVGVPVGATQGSASALGYSQSWTIGNGSTGELYLTRTEKKILGASNRIGSYSPVEG
ncbi:MAG: hypothetical protein IIT64_09175 [Bacteroidaceae bacterium]|nr:hypothetical protein [Bacteroidaceae bacterium]